LFYTDHCLALNVPTDRQGRQNDGAMRLDSFPVLMVDWPNPHIRFGHSECGFDLKQLVVIGDHLIIRDIQVGDISFDACKCSCFVD
jgi:hypothetical protein